MQKMREKFAKKKRYLSNHFANALNSKCESVEVERILQPCTKFSHL